MAQFKKLKSYFIFNWFSKKVDLIFTCIYVRMFVRDYLAFGWTDFLSQPVNFSIILLDLKNSSTCKIV